MAHHQDATSDVLEILLIFNLIPQAGDEVLLILELLLETADFALLRGNPLLPFLQLSLDGGEAPKSGVCLS